MFIFILNVAPALSIWCMYPMHPHTPSIKIICVRLITNCLQSKRINVFHAYYPAQYLCNLNSFSYIYLAHTLTQAICSKSLNLLVAPGNLFTVIEFACSLHYNFWRHQVSVLLVIVGRHIAHLVSYGFFFFK